MIAAFILAEEPITGPQTVGIIFALIMAVLLLVVMPLSYLFQGLTKYRAWRLKPRYKSHLQKLNYYRQLKPQHRKRFEIRVQKFINQKKFISRSKSLIVSDEMKVKIAASAVELTFGWKDFRFEHFERILIYPDDYYSKISKRYHRGEVNPGGIIVLSWKAFEEGYADPMDGINLGIHEMAHALKLENTIHNADYQFISDKQGLSIEMAYDKLRNGMSPLEGFFRAYAKSNVHEFFSVSCENFLERPEEFQSTDPQYYALLCAILRQNPLDLRNNSTPQVPTPSAMAGEVAFSKGPIERY